MVADSRLARGVGLDVFGHRALSVELCMATRWTGVTIPRWRYERTSEKRKLRRRDPCLPSASKMTSSSLSADLRDKSSCIGTTEVRMREEFFQLVQQPGQHPCASGWGALTHGRERRDAPESRFSGPHRRPLGDDS